MRIKLLEFQAEASTALLKNLDKMWRDYRTDGTLSATTLQAPTGSGKTVISADVIETLFFGDDSRGIEGDPKACVLWVSESPSLNAQTMNRFMTASDRLADNLYDHMHVEEIQNTFCAENEELKANRVYFLSKNLLASGKILTSGGEGGRTFWYVLKRTIEDPDRHLFLFIDEAHLGLSGSVSDGRPVKTIYANLIDGVEGESLPMPAVVGVSATPQSFEAAMHVRRDRDLVHTVTVPPSVVQDSGLLKDRIVLGVPEGDDQVGHRYLVMACERLAMARTAWAAYCDRERTERVVPLLVVQVRDGITDEELRELCRQIRLELPDLDPSTAFAHVFGTHNAIYAKPYAIPYVEPENVAGMKEIQVLFAKEAVSNGWDCPRAEVLLSYRRRRQEAYVTQLIGRMVRNPLARRVESDETLNSVAVYLPDFDPETVDVVVDYLTGERDDLSVAPVSDVVVNPVRIEPAVPRTREEYEAEVAEYDAAVAEAREAWKASRPTLPMSEGGNRNADEQVTEEQSTSEPQQVEELDPRETPDSRETRLPPTVAYIPKPKPITRRDSSFTPADMAAVKKAWTSLIVERVPKGSVKNPFVTLVDTATLMMDTGWEPTAGRDIHLEFCRRVDGAIVAHQGEYNRVTDGVLHAETQIIEIEGVIKGYNRIADRRNVRPVADARDIEIEAGAATRRLGGKDLVNAYRAWCVCDQGMTPLETNLRLAAVARTQTIIDDLQDWARKRRDKYLEAHHGDLAYATEEQRAEYDRIQGESGLTQERHPEWPSAKDVSGTASDGTDCVRYPRHILQDADGFCPLDLNTMEQDVLCHEMLRSNAVAFYRNPAGARTPVAFSVNYTNVAGNRSACHPDFVFFMRMPDKSVRPSIVDPHTASMSDALPKLKGYVRYLRKYPDMFIQAVSVSDLSRGDEYRCIDLKDAVTQDRIMSCSDDSVEALYLENGISYRYGEKSELPGLLKRLGVVNVLGMGK